MNRPANTSAAATATQVGLVDEVDVHEAEVDVGEEIDGGEVLAGGALDETGAAEGMGTAAKPAPGPM